jgi:hypothetical protein
MSTIASFTPEEQVLVREVIPLVGLAVATAGNSGIIGTFKEAVAVARGMTDAATQYPQNELIQSLIKDLSQNRPTMPSYSSTQPNVQQQIKSDALEKCRQVVALLSQKANTQEASDFKRWIISVSEKVANAAKEGGFLGFGGQRVSEAETATLKEIATVLEV